MSDRQPSTANSDVSATAFHVSPASLVRDEIDNVVAGLKTMLATTYDVYLRSQWAHWNVTGPHFASLHDLFETQYDGLSEAIDVIAERIRTLGAPAPGSFAEFSQLTALDERSEASNAASMLEELVLSNERAADLMRALIPVAEKARDEGTIDLLGARIRTHEKAAWMLRSVLDRV